MEMWLTKGMFGDKTELVAPETDSVKTVFEKLYMWKHNPANEARYKIERYDRMVFREGEMAIDFGDYSSFMLVTGLGPGEKAQLADMFKGGGD